MTGWGMTFRDRHVADLAARRLRRRYRQALVWRRGEHVYVLGEGVSRPWAALGYGPRSGPWPIRTAETERAVR